MKGGTGLAELRASPGYPSEERLERGPVAVIECIQEIPCNPCESACRFGAIIVGQPITNLPRLIEDRCRGCGECMLACPGLAIFLVDRTHSQDEAAVSIPYEHFPLPKEGSVVSALDREGRRVCRGRIIRVIEPSKGASVIRGTPSKDDRTAIVTVTVPKACSDLVRNIKMPC